MNLKVKGKTMKKVLEKIVLVIGVILLGIVSLLNILFVASIKNDWTEHVTISYVGILNSVIIFFMIIGIVTLSKYQPKFLSNKKDKKKLKVFYIVCFAIILLIYLVVQILWVKFRNLYPVADQKFVYEMAKYLHNKDLDSFHSYDYYIKLYPHQITLVYLWKIIFDIFHSSNTLILQILNAIANCFTIVALYFIMKLFSKDYNVNIILGLFVSITSIVLPMLAIFIYGDEIGLALALWGVYFMMKYGKDNKFYNFIVSSLLLMISYLFRMNNLVVILAIICYLGIKVFEKEERKIDYIKKIALILLFVLISLMPGTILKNVLNKKNNIATDRSFPVTGYFAMGMSETIRANGWYKDDLGKAAFDNVEIAKTMYKEVLDYRISTFKNSPKYFIKFYVKKIASMWCENTYGAMWTNQASMYEENDNERNRKVDGILQNKSEKIYLYQKALMVILFVGALSALIKNRKNISDEMLLLLIIFIGGFLFHILWEAKSRYIITYVISLIPLMTVMGKKEREEK